MVEKVLRQEADKIKNNTKKTTNTMKDWHVYYTNMIPP